MRYFRCVVTLSEFSDGAEFFLSFEVVVSDSISLVELLWELSISVILTWLYLLRLCLGILIVLKLLHGGWLNRQLLNKDVAFPFLLPRSSRHRCFIVSIIVIRKFFKLLIGRRWGLKRAETLIRLLSVKFIEFRGD